MSQISLVYSTHRPETLAEASRLMERFDAIVLEEPKTPGFSDMLSGDLPVEDYLLEQDLEYPDFSRESCLMLQRLHRSGKTILQVEPFLEKLLQIHEFFADGGSPASLDRHSPLYPVYEAEKDATGSLIRFYRTAVTASFEATVESVKAFARDDAKRFILRDRMRAEALAPVAGTFASTYIEAGAMHVRLWNELRRNLSEGSRLEQIQLMESANRSIWGRRHTFGPGDLLTMLFIYHPGFSGPKADLLAARSLIYNKILEKEEMAPSTDPYPHLRNETESIQAVSRLSLGDCRKLYPRIRLAGTIDARVTVHHYLSEVEGDLSR